MKKSLVLLTLLAAACSRDPQAGQLQQRIGELEQQNEQLQHELQKAKNDVAALQRVLAGNARAANPDDSGPSVDTPGQPTLPQPDNALGGMPAQ